MSPGNLGRCALGVLLLLFVDVSSTQPALADDMVRHCVDVRGLTRAPRLVNKCSFDINAFVCCYDQGSLGSCQGNGFQYLSVGSGATASFPSCDRSAVASACRAPLVFEEVYWDAARDVVVVSPCVDEAAFGETASRIELPTASGAEGNDGAENEPLALAGAQMPGEDLRRFNLSGAYLSNTNLDATNLFLVDMTGANCRGATFRGANLQYTKLVGADLTHADITGADMQGTRTRDATFCNTTMPDGTINNDGCPQ